MTLESFSFKWFTVYYAVFGILLFYTGGYLIVKSDSVYSYLLGEARNKQPPPLLRKTLKYLLLFTLASLVLSLFPFSWPEFLFSVWCLFMVYLAGSQLVRWSRLRKLIENRPEGLRTIIRRAGAMLLSAAIVIFLLEYLLIKRVQLY